MQAEVCGYGSKGGQCQRKKGLHLWAAEKTELTELGNKQKKKKIGKKKKKKGSFQYFGMLPKEVT